MGPQMEPLSKESLRRLALDARKAFVATISDAERTMLEQRLAQHLTSLCSEARVVGGYAPLGSEISPLLAMEEARAVGRIVAFPRSIIRRSRSSSAPATRSSQDRSGSCSRTRRSPVVEPDLILVPLIAIDGNGTRLGRGKGHYDRALARLKKSGARLVGVGWALQRLVETIPADEWDVPLDAFASPEGLEIFRR